MSDYTAVVARMSQKVEDAAPDTLRFLLRQSRRQWDAFLSLSAKRYDMEIAGLNTSDHVRILMQMDNDLDNLSKHIVRVTEHVERGA